MRVDGDRRVSEGDVEDNVGRLSAHAGQGDELVEVLGHLSRVFVAKDFGESHDVLGLVAVEADRLNEGREALDAECGDLLGRVRNRKESGRRDVDALVGRLCGELRRKAANCRAAPDKATTHIDDNDTPDQSQSERYKRHRP